MEVLPREAIHLGLAAGSKEDAILATGRAPEVISAAIGLRPVADDRALLIGARDLDDQERDALMASGVRRTLADPRLFDPLRR